MAFVLLLEGVGRGISWRVLGASTRGRNVLRPPGSPGEPLQDFALGRDAVVGADCVTWGVVEERGHR